MVSRSTSLVPRIDVGAILEGRLDSDAAQRVCGQIRAACSDIGFMTVIGHGVSRGQIDSTVAAAQRFFALPESAKLAVAPQRWNAANENVYRGYFPSSVAGKEGLDVGEPHLDRAELLARPFHERNCCPEELSGEWQRTIDAYFDALSALGAALLRAIVAAVGGQPERVGVAFARPASLSTLRFNFYPERDLPVAVSPQDGAELSCEAHVDSGFLTLLHQDDRGGLQVRGVDKCWHTLEPDADAFVVNTGLALQQMTGGTLAATQHRVLYAKRPRLSMPFFFEPIPDFLMDAASLKLPFPKAPRKQDYESFLRESLAKFSEYAR